MDISDEFAAMPPGEKRRLIEAAIGAAKLPNVSSQLDGISSPAVMPFIPTVAPLHPSAAPGLYPSLGPGTITPSTHDPVYARLVALESQAITERLRREELEKKIYELAAEVEHQEVRIETLEKENLQLREDLDLLQGVRQITNTPDPEAF